jgi:Ca2+-binding protein (EF-Hand superfamily)
MSDFTEDQKKEFKEAFSLFDTDKDGFITSKELGDLMKKLGLNPTEAELQDMINEIDYDGSGTIDFEEFISLISRKMKEPGIENELMEAFKIFDQDGTGMITTNAFKKIIRDLSDKLTDTEIEDMLAEADPDADGYIKFEDLIKIMLGKA